MEQRLNKLLGAYASQRTLDTSWLDCPSDVMRERIKEHVDRDGKMFVLREVHCFIRSVSHAIGKRIVGDEAYDEAYALEFPWTDSTEDFLQSLKELAKVLREELDVNYDSLENRIHYGNIICILHSLMDKLRYKPYGDEVHSNNENDHIFQKLYRGETLTDDEQILMQQAIQNENEIDYKAWWNEVTR